MHEANGVDIEFYTMGNTFINIDFDDNTIKLSQNGNPNWKVETYNIVEDNTHIIQAIGLRPGVPPYSQNAFLTFSKDVGLGAVIGQQDYDRNKNIDEGIFPYSSIEHMLFQCQ